jgi:DNA topoisomerase-2
MVMTDQDQDGSHIKGLLFNFFHFFFPTLMALPGFLKVFVTPIVKVSKGPQVKSFFSLHEYAEWKKAAVAEAGQRALAAKPPPGVSKDAAKLQAESTALKAWRVKYYKGLGTNSSKEAQEYFVNLKDHTMTMT